MRISDSILLLINLFFFDIRILITPLVSSNSSHIYLQESSGTFEDTKEVIRSGEIEEGWVIQREK